MNYNFIRKEEELFFFIRNVLPDLKEDERYIIRLSARQKYDPNKSIPSGIDIKRVTCTKDHLYDKLKALEIERGLYTYKEKEIPYDSMALYISQNPRNAIKAAGLFASDVVKKMANGHKIGNPESLLKTKIQATLGTSHFINLDFDDILGYPDNLDFYDHVNRVLPNVEKDFIKTRGGMHVLLHIKSLKENKINWLKHMKDSDLPPFEIKRDDFIPIPGTYQGGHIPYLLKYKYYV